MAISDLGLGIGDLRDRRSGVTILEVMFSILVTTIGLLGAIALFPVASGQTRKARMFETMAVAGRSAVHTFDARGMRRPDMWMARAPAGTYVNYGPNASAPGEAFCIDGRFVAANSGSVAAQFFPYQEPFTDANTNGRFDPSESFTDLGVQLDDGQTVQNGIHDPPYNSTKSQPTPMMRRITLRNANLGTAPAMGSLLANRIFSIDDDMAIDRDMANRANPATQVFDYLTSGAPSRRQTEGRLSWMATLVPKIDDYSGEVSDEFVLSTVLFQDRRPDLAIDALRERVVHAYFEGDGSTGGEVRLHWNCGTNNLTNLAAAEKVLKVRPGDWIMVMGAKQSSLATFMARFQWYRVAAADHEVLYNDGSDNSRPLTPFDGTAGYEVYVSLIGQDWNTSLINPQVNAAYGTFGNPSIFGTAQATLIEGVVAVHEKTIRLEYGSAF